MHVAEGTKGNPVTALMVSLDGHRYTVHDR
jgi:hypothetical protein